MSAFKTFQNSRFIKALLYFFIGIFSWPGLLLFNKLTVKGMETLHNLPKKNVLFVSNHQTYFADVITLIHIFCAVKWGKQKGLGIPYYLLWPFTRVYYVAAEETMKSSVLSKIFKIAGGLTVKRTWNAASGEVRRGLDPSDTRKITNALQNNWVITFPQGTTKPFAPGRKGAAFIIKQTKPIVIPVIIKGFSQAFDKKGLRLVKKGTKLSVEFKEPLQIDYEQNSDEILDNIMDAIEQSKKFMPNPSAA